MPQKRKWYANGRSWLLVILATLSAALIKAAEEVAKHFAENGKKGG